jgi:hypothetical protein
MDRTSLRRVSIRLVSGTTPMHSRSGWREDVELVPLELANFPPQKAMFIARKRLLTELSIASLSVLLGDAASAITRVLK